MCSTDDTDWWDAEQCCNNRIADHTTPARLLGPQQRVRADEQRGCSDPQRYAGLKTGAVEVASALWQAARGGEKVAASDKRGA